MTIGRSMVVWNVFPRLTESHTRKEKTKANANIGSFLSFILLDRDMRLFYLFTITTKYRNKVNDMQWNGFVRRVDIFSC